jgi:epsin
MLRNFHYIDEKGKDEGVNGMASLTFLVFCVDTSSQSAIVLVNLWNYFPMSKESAQSAGRQRPTEPSIPALAMMEWALAAQASSLVADVTATVSIHLIMAALGMVGYSWISSTPVLYSDYNSGGSSSRTAGGSSFSDNRRPYEEYDAGDDELTATPTRSNSVRNPTRKSSAPPPQVAAPQPAVDLLGGFDDPPTTTPGSGLARNKALPSVDGMWSQPFMSTKFQYYASYL